MNETGEVVLCARILVESFENDHLAALRLCERLVKCPIEASDAQQDKRRARREGVVAIARAAAGVADEDDLLALEKTATVEPLLFWACRYGAALTCRARTARDMALALVDDAPAWPVSSAFRRLQGEILADARPARVA